VICLSSFEIRRSRRKSKPENLWTNKTSKFPDNSIKDILNEHNKYRSNITDGTTKCKSGLLPSASDMVQIYWDEKLAKTAQLWANNCEAAPSDQQFRSYVGQYVGENMASFKIADEKSSQIMDWIKVIGNWFNEVKDFDMAYLFPYQLTETSDRFTQIVWAKTNFVGCGFSVFKNPSGETYQLYVCHYRPGSVVTKSLYSAGKSCDKCPNGYVCESEYKGLCCVKNFCKADSLEVKSKRKLKK